MHTSGEPRTLEERRELGDESESASERAPLGAGPARGSAPQTRAGRSCREVAAENCLQHVSERARASKSSFSAGSILSRQQEEHCLHTNSETTSIALSRNVLQGRGNGCCGGQGSACER